jgi:DNA repair exonuclease SbcCD ATPase subunit
MSERARPSKEPELELPDEDAMSGEHLDNQVQKAQEQLVALKRQQEQIERQKRELEELSRRQEQLGIGRQEMLEKFTRAIVVLERETYEAQKRVELLQGLQESFNSHVSVLEMINPKSWDGLDINKELNKALSAVDDSRAEYAKSIPKIAPESSNESGGDPVASSAGFQLDYGGGGDPKDFTYWLKAGFAFTLPLIGIAIILIVVIVAVFTRPA